MTSFMGVPRPYRHGGFLAIQEKYNDKFWPNPLRTPAPNLRSYTSNLKSYPSSVHYLPSAIFPAGYRLSIHRAGGCLASFENTKAVQIF